MMDAVFVTRPLFSEVLERLRRHFDVRINEQDRQLSAAELAAQAASCSGMLSTAFDPLDAALLAQCPNLRAVCSCAAGYNNIDVAACTARGIKVTNTPGVLDETTADLGLALMLAAARQVVAADRWLREGKWEGWKFHQWLGADVNDATLGIFGLGRIGKAVARRAAGFSMRVLYHNRRQLSERVEGLSEVSYAGKDELLRESDFVMLTLPYSPQSHHYIGEREIALMKPNAVLINIARGGLVDDAALARALGERRIAAAGLDVFEDEPALNPALLALPNVVLTPHIGSASRGTRLRMANLAADNLIAALNGGAPPNLVNVELARR